MEEPRVVRNWQRLARVPPKFTDYLGDTVKAPPITVGSFVTCIATVVVMLVVRQLIPIPTVLVVVVALLAGGVYYVIQEMQLGSPQLAGQGVLTRLRDQLQRLIDRHQRVPRPRGRTRKD